MQLLYSSNIPGLLENVSISQIKLPEFYYRGEKEYDDDIENLILSMKQYGLLNPITVRNSRNYFEIVTGVRRYKASKILGWRKILCHVIDVTDKEAYEISLMSNLQHKQLDPVEEAMAFKKYLYNYKWGQISELAFKIGKSHSYIHRRLKLLECSQEIIDAISQRRIERSIAEEIISIKNQDIKTNLISLYTIGLGIAQPVGTRVDSGQGSFVLKRLAQQTGGRAFFPKEPKNLAGVYAEIRQELSRQYSLAYESNSACRNGEWRRITVRVNRPDVIVRNKLGYFAPNK